MANKEEPVLESQPSDWLGATQVTGFVLIQISETFSSKVEPGRESEWGEKGKTEGEEEGESRLLLLGILKVPEGSFSLVALLLNF